MVAEFVRILHREKPTPEFSRILLPLLLAAFALFPCLATAEAPRDPKAGSTGNAALDSLKSRSPDLRWKALESTAAPLRPPNPQSAPAIVTPQADGPKAEPFPDPTKPRPLPEKTAKPTAPPKKPAKSAAPKIAVAPRSLPTFQLDEVVLQPEKSVVKAPAPKRDTTPVLRPLNKIDPYPDYRPPDYVPPKQRREPVPTWQDQKYERLQFANRMFNWEASNLTYNPLYFEDVPLERYGHSYPEIVQPFASIALFSAQLLGLPYQAAIDPVHKEIYTLGYYRPGEACIPKLFYRVPWNAEAAGVEAGVATGLFFLIP